jgi:competence protein ComGC
MEMEDDKRGFTVMELFIIAIVVCIVVAVAVPRFSMARSRGKLSDMVSKLQQVRSQIALYKVQHDGLLPGQNAKGSDIAEDGFVKAMTEKDTTGFGPYLREIPANCFIEGESAKKITLVNDADAIPGGDEETGWWFNAATEKFCASDCKFHAEY